MTVLQQTQQRLSQHRASLVSRYPIRRMALFGSVARNESTPGSDVDILVEFSQPVGFQFFELAQELETLLGQKVDLVSRNGIKPAYFSAILPDLVDV
jgi:uncharacterized protein